MVAVGLHQNGRIDRVLQVQIAAGGPRGLHRLVKQRRQPDRAERQGRWTLARVVERPPHKVGRPIDRLRQRLAGTLHLGIGVDCKRSAVSSAGVRMPRRSWLTFATTVPSAASLALRQSAARNSCCMAASSRPATATSSFRSPMPSFGSSGTVRSGSARNAAMLPVIRRMGRTSNKSTAR